MTKPSIKRVYDELESFVKVIEDAFKTELGKKKSDFNPNDKYKKPFHQRNNSYNSNKNQQQQQKNDNRAADDQYNNNMQHQNEGNTRDKRNNPAFPIPHSLALVTTMASRVIGSAIVAKHQMLFKPNGLRSLTSVEMRNVNNVMRPSHDGTG